MIYVRIDRRVGLDHEDQGMILLGVVCTANRTKNAIGTFYLDEEDKGFVLNDTPQYDYYWLSRDPNFIEEDEDDEEFPMLLIGPNLREEIENGTFNIDEYDWYDELFGPSEHTIDIDPVKLEDVMEEEIKLQLSYSWENKAFPIDWNRLPAEVIDKIPSEYYCNILSWTGDKEVREKTIIYFRRVRGFKKEAVKYKDGNITFGI